MDTVRYKNDREMTCDEAVERLKKTQEELIRLEQKEKEEKWKRLSKYARIDDSPMMVEELYDRWSEWKKEYEEELKMNAEKEVCKQQILACIRENLYLADRYILFLYNDELCGMSLLSNGHFLLWYGYRKQEFNLFDEMMEEKFFDGNCLRDLLISVVFRSVGK